MGQDTRKDPRAKVLSLNVRYKSATVDEFIEHHSHDISKGGIFIKTPSPFPAGTLLKFEIRIKEDQPIIAGVGRVVWRREPVGASGPEKPAGMGVKFIKLDGASRELIDRISAERKTEGLTFEETADGSPPADNPLVVAPAAEPVASFFPAGPPAELPPPGERTVIRQTNEILADTLKNAGFGLDAVAASAPEEGLPEVKAPPSTPPKPEALGADGGDEEDDLPAEPVRKKPQRKQTMMGLGRADRGQGEGLPPDIAAAIAEVTSGDASKVAADAAAPLRSSGAELKSAMKGLEAPVAVAVTGKGTAAERVEADKRGKIDGPRDADKRRGDAPKTGGFDASAAAARSTLTPAGTERSGPLMWVLVAVLAIGALGGVYFLRNKRDGGAVPVASTPAPSAPLVTTLPSVAPIPSASPATAPTPPPSAASALPTAASTLAPKPTAEVIAPTPVTPPKPTADVVAPTPVIPPRPPIVPTPIARPRPPVVAPAPPTGAAPTVAPTPPPKPKKVDEYGE